MNDGTSVTFANGPCEVGTGKTDGAAVAGLKGKTIDGAGGMTGGVSDTGTETGKSVGP